MERLKVNEEQFSRFTEDVQVIIEHLTKIAKPREDIGGVEELLASFKRSIADFEREDRKLNIGVVGQVKAGKSSFLNTLLFDGREVLPKAATPKTATLTKMEYSEDNIIQIEYYTESEWDAIENNAEVDSDEERYVSAREIIFMLRRSGIDPREYLKKGHDEIRFDTYEDLVAHLNDYVGEDGKFTPLVKAVTLFLHNPDFKGLSIVDTPGLNDPIASRTLRTKDFIEVCDVVFFLSQSGSFLDKSDWILLSSQLPQNGVKRLVLIASKSDSGLRDILREHNSVDDKYRDEDDEEEDDSHTDSIPKACQILKRDLTDHARRKVKEYTQELEERDGFSQELIRVVSECASPILISSMVHNMLKKEKNDYTAEEKNVFLALKQFSKNIEDDLNTIGDFTLVDNVFNEVVSEKEAILERKARDFVPTTTEKLRGLLTTFKEVAQEHSNVLSNNDKAQLEQKRKAIEKQIGNIKADITTVFGELSVKLEEEKISGIRELREASKDYMDIRERVKTKTVREAHTVSDAKWYIPWTWGKSHTEYTTYTEHYNYCIASDAVDNLRKYSLEATSQIEKVFTEALQLKELQRKLLNIVADNFDMGSETFDSSLFRIMVANTISSIQFPVFQMDFSDEMNEIAGAFAGELTSVDEMTALSNAQAKAIGRIYLELSAKLTDAVAGFKCLLDQTSKNIQESMLKEINETFETLIQECDSKDAEISAYEAYIMALDMELDKL